MEKKAYYLLDKLILKNHIRIHREELRLQLHSHPSYPSVHALTGVLDHFSIPNLAARVPVTAEILGQLPTCFIAVMKADTRQDIALVEKRNNGSIKLTYHNRDIRSVTSDQFLLDWSGILIAIEKDEAISETKPSYTTVVMNGILWTLGLLATGYFIFSNPNVLPSTHFLLSLVGAVFSVYLVKHELGYRSKTVQSFCNFSENTSCDAVLDSKGASVLGSFKLSDVSLITFSGYLCAWFLFQLTGSANYSPFYALSAIAVPAVMYSVYYQYAVVKKWCPLCLAVCAVLLLQFGILFTGDLTVSSVLFDINTIVLFASGFVLTLMVWYFLKPLLKRKSQLNELKVEHFRFKRNFSIFDALHREGARLTSWDSIPNEIVLGPDDAPINLILVTSPFCYYCKGAHRDIETILNNAKDRVNVTIRFMVGAEDKDSDFYKIVSQLVHIYNSQGKAACLYAMQELYKEDADLRAWTSDQNIPSHPEYDYIIQEQKHWCQENGINFTPALYLFDRLYPREYDRTDLLYFIDELVASCGDAKTSEEEKIAS